MVATGPTGFNQKIFDRRELGLLYIEREFEGNLMQGRYFVKKQKSIRKISRWQLKVESLKVE